MSSPGLEAEKKRRQAGRNKQQAAKLDGDCGSESVAGTADRPPRSASACFAYACWFIGGFWGLHHLYLDRPLQAFLWASSLGMGGFFGCGVLRDAFCIPSYVSACNDSDLEREHLEADMKYRKIPPWKVSRLLGMQLFGLWFDHVGSCLGPAWFPEPYFIITSAVFGALGVWLVGNAATHQAGSLRWTLMARISSRLVVGSGWSSMCSVAAFQYTRRWEREAGPGKFKPARWKVIMMMLLFWPVVGLCTFEHGHVMKDGQKYKVKDSIHNILKGLDFEDMHWSFDTEFWTKLQNSLDTTGERYALKTLNMTDFLNGDSYTEADVKQRFKQMAKLHHPDRVPASEKGAAEQKMAEINKAKETLDNILKMRR